MRPLILSAFALLGLAAANGCAPESREPQPAATQGGEDVTLLAPQTVAVVGVTDAHLAARLSEAYGPEIESAKVMFKGPALAAGDLTEQPTAWKQAGATLEAAKAANLDDLPKCQEL